MRHQSQKVTSAASRIACLAGRASRLARDVAAGQAAFPLVTASGDFIAGAVIRAVGLQRIGARAARDGDDFKISTQLAAFYLDHFEVPTEAEGLLTVIG